MSCEICGRSSCTRSFHSLEEQEAFDNIANVVKERCKRIIYNAVNSVDGKHDENDVYLIDLNEALKAIDNADL